MAENLRNIRTRRLVFTQRNKDKLVDRQAKADKQGESVYAEEQIQIGRHTSKVRQTRRICLRRGTKTDW